MHKNKYKIHSEFVSFSNNLFFYLFGWRHTHTCTRHDLQQRLQQRMKQRHKTHKYFAATGTKNVKFFFSLYCLNVWQIFFFYCRCRCWAIPPTRPPLGRFIICSTLMRSSFFDYFITIFQNILIFSLNCCLITWSINWQGEMWKNPWMKYLSPPTAKCIDINSNWFHCD